MQRHGTDVEGQNEMHMVVSETGYDRQNSPPLLSNKSFMAKGNLVS